MCYSSLHLQEGLIKVIEGVVVVTWLSATTMSLVLRNNFGVGVAGQLVNRSTGRLPFSTQQRNSTLQSFSPKWLSTTMEFGGKARIMHFIGNVF